MRSTAKSTMRKLSRAAFLAVAIAVCLAGCTAADTVARPEAAFSGKVFESTQAAMAEKDGNAVLTSVAMQSYANADETPNWTYLYASKTYGKYYVVFNDGTDSTTGIYGDTRWNDAEWDKAAATSKESIDEISIDADAAYKKVVDEYYEGRSSNPFRMALIVYDADNARTSDSPSLMTWYIYVANQEKLDELNNEASQKQNDTKALDDNGHLGATTGEGSGSHAPTYDDAIDATYTVDALTGEVQKL